MAAIDQCWIFTIWILYGFFRDVDSSKGLLPNSLRIVRHRCIRMRSTRCPLPAGIPFIHILLTQTHPWADHLSLEPLPPSKSAKVGKSIAIMCTLAEGRNAQFSWTKNGLVLREDDRVQIVNLRRTSTLHIDDVVSSDSAAYTCTARSGGFEDRQSSTLLVEGGLSSRQTYIWINDFDFCQKK